MTTKTTTWSDRRGGATGSTMIAPRRARGSQVRDADASACAATAPIAMPGF